MKKVKTKLRVILFIFIFIVVSGSLSMKFIKISGNTAPKAKKRKFSFQKYGCTINDNYHWLKDKSRNQKDVLKYIEEENNYTAKMTRKNSDLQEVLFQEMINSRKEVDSTLPYKIGNYYYYSRKEKGKQYSVFCRKEESLSAEEVIYFDMNKMAEGHKYYGIEEFSLSPNQEFLAFTEDTSGDELCTLKILKISSGEILSDSAYPASSVEWANDNKTIFYGTVNKANRTDKIFRHKLGDKTENDKLIFHEKDGRFYAWISHTKNLKYLLIGVSSSTTSEVYFLKRDNPLGEFKLFCERQQGVEYEIYQRGKYFFIETNENAENKKIMITPIQNYQKENWQEFIPEQENVTISFSLFKDFYFVNERKNGVDGGRIINFNTSREIKDPLLYKEKSIERRITFSESSYSFYTMDNYEFDTQFLRYGYESLVTPYTIFDYDINSGKSIVRKEDEILGDFDRNNYFSERIFAQAEDGTKIPISLVYRKDSFKKDGSCNLLLEGYGAYGTISDPYFSTSRNTLLDRGIVYAIAHIRGGGEMGEKWYKHGKMFEKKNTFTDFISCSEFLINEKYTSSSNLAIAGGSAGGLLMGAVVNLRPDLFEVVLADVPFVDVLETMLDSTLSATMTEYEEWGNPNKEKYFNYIKSYCPYQNVQKQDYPNMLITGGFYDPRVNYWEPTKWTAKLREFNTSDNIILLKINMSGHGGASGRYDYYQELAFQYAFLLNILN